MRTLSSSPGTASPIQSSATLFSFQSRVFSFQFSVFSLEVSVLSSQFDAIGTVSSGVLLQFSTVTQFNRGPTFVLKRSTLDFDLGGQRSCREAKGTSSCAPTPTNSTATVSPTPSSGSGLKVHGFGFKVYGPDLFRLSFFWEGCFAHSASGFQLETPVTVVRILRSQAQTRNTSPGTASPIPTSAIQDLGFGILPSLFGESNSLHHTIIWDSEFGV